MRRWHNHTPLEAGMVVSNEPGYYEDGAFGIRIENLLVIREQPTPHRFGGQAYLGFERLTLCPLQRKMIALEARPAYPHALGSLHAHSACECRGAHASAPMLRPLQRNTMALQARAPRSLARATASCFPVRFHAEVSLGTSA